MLYTVFCDETDTYRRLMLGETSAEARRCSEHTRPPDPSSDGSDIGRSEITAESFRANGIASKTTELKPEADTSKMSLLYRTGRRS